MSLAYDVVPVTLVTGFLGSGKSTLLADILTGEAARDTAVLVNEFGEIGLDHLLMGKVDTQTVLLDNGCVCCSIRGELKDALADLFSRRARGEVPAFSRVVLETTGLATPAPIIATLLADPLIRTHYTLNATVTVVDSVNAHEQHARYPEWLSQVTVADRIVVSKVDLVDTAHVEALKDELYAINPAARIVERNLSADGLLALLFAPSYEVAAAIARIGRSGTGVVRLGSGDGRLAHRTETSGTRLASHCFRIDAPLDWQVFTLWFTMLLNRHGDKILRVKGLLALNGSDRPTVLHAVQHLVYPVLHLDEWPDDTRVSQLVFITEDLDGSAIEASYQRFVAALEEPA
jgi:G3E family GTPase